MAAPVEQVDWSAPVRTPRRFVRLDRIDEDPKNARITFDPAALASLAASIKENGIRYPLLVRQVGDRLRLIDGARRFRAAQMAGLEQVPIDIQDLDEKNAAIAAAESNLQREDLTPYEQARALKTAIDAGMLRKDVCVAAGITENTLRARLELLDLPEELGRLIKVGRGGFSVQHAQVVAQLAKYPKAWAAAKAYVETANGSPDGIPQLERFGRALAEALVEAKAAKTTNYQCLGDRWYRLSDHVHAALKGTGTPALKLGHEFYYLDLDAFNQAANAARKTLEDQERRQQSGSSSGGRRAPAQIDVKQRERNRQQRLQLELLQEHVPKTKAYGKDWQHIWLHRYLDRLGLIAATKVEREAFGRITGWTNWDGRGSSLAARCDKLGWDSVEAGRIMHAALYFETNQRSAWSGEFGVATRYAERLLGAKKEAIKARAHREVADELKPKPKSAAKPAPKAATAAPASPTALVRDKIQADAKAGNLRMAQHYIRWLVDQPGMHNVGLKQAKPIVYRELREAKTDAKVNAHVAKATTALAGLEAAKAKLAQQKAATRNVAGKAATATRTKVKA